jgi:hypothetical protein
MASDKPMNSGICPKTHEPGLARDGFAVLRGFLKNDERTKILELVTSMLRSPGGFACSRPHNTLLPLRWNDDLVQLILNSGVRMESLRTKSHADDLRWISGYISIKESRSPALWWHQDWWCWDHKVSYQPAAAQTAVLCYLAETTPNNGALRVLPGSHHKASPIHALLPDPETHATEDLAPTHAAMSNLGGQVTLSMKAGDAALIDYRLLHGTHANSSDVRRECIILNFTPSWRHLPEDIRAHLISHTAQPSAKEIVPSGVLSLGLLPDFPGERKDLVLNRKAPRDFQVAP